MLNHYSKTIQSIRLEQSMYSLSEVRGLWLAVQTTYPWIVFHKIQELQLKILNLVY